MLYGASISACEKAGQWPSALALLCHAKVERCHTTPGCQLMVVFGHIVLQLDGLIYIYIFIQICRKTYVLL